MLQQTEIQGFQSVVNWVKAFGGLSLIVGLLSMALLQMVKDPFPWRRWFQEQSMRHWFAKGVETFLRAARKQEESGTSDSPEFAQMAIDDAIPDIVRLGTVGEGNAFFNLPVEQLCGQMNAAISLALHRPSGHIVTLWCIARLTNGDDLTEVINPPAEEILGGLQKDLGRSDRRKLDILSRKDCS